MFFDFLKKKENTLPAAPSFLGLRLGGCIKLDGFKLKLMEEFTTFQDAAETQLIEAVGEVTFDAYSKILRFYTDDEGFIQILTSGDDERNIKEIKLFYFYETIPVDSSEQWEHIISHELVEDNKIFNGKTYQKIWQNEKPVAMTETTWIHRDKTTTDQFIMIYASTENNHTEYLFVSAEEKIINNQIERALILSTGVDLLLTDITIIG